MKLSKLLEKVHTHSGKASDTARQLSFAGIAMAWIFKQESINQIVLPNSLVVAIICFAVSLAAHLLQYVWSASSLKIIHRSHEKKKEKPTDDPEIRLSVIPSRGGYILFITKVLAVIVGYAVLISYLAKLIR